MELLLGAGSVVFLPSMISHYSLYHICYEKEGMAYNLSLASLALPSTGPGYLRNQLYLPGQLNLAA